MITVGEGDSGAGGQISIRAGTTTGDNSNGGSIYIRPGEGTLSGGSTVIYSADGTTTTFTVADTSVSISTGTVTITTTSSTTIDAGSTISLEASSGILLASSKVSGYEFGLCTVSSLACSADFQTGIIAASTTNLAAGASETIVMTNSRVTASGVVLVSVQDRCTLGYVMVASVTVTANTASVVTTNIGTYACTSDYKLAYFVVS
jgi:hypothetical protein